MSEKSIVLEGISGIKPWNSVATGVRTITEIMLSTVSDEVIPDPIAECVTLAWDYTLLISGAGLRDFNDDVDLWEYVYHGLMTESLLWFRAREENAFPAIHADTILQHWINDFTAGYLSLPIPWLDGAGAATTDFDESIEGLLHVDVSGVTTHAYHMHWMRRFAYALGCMEAKERLKLVESITATPSLTVRTRQIQHLANKCAMIFCFLFPLMALQTEKMFFSLGQMIKGLVREERIPRFGTSIDQFFEEYMRRFKVNYLAGTPISNHASLLNDPADFVLVDSELMNLAVSRMRTEFMVPGKSLEVSRNLIGIAMAPERMGKNNHYVIGFNMLTSEDYPLHPFKYTVGLQMVEVLNMFNNVSDILMRMLGKVREQAHWTWVEKSVQVDLMSAMDFMVPFNFVDHLKGLANPSVIPGLERNIAFDTWGSLLPYDSSHAGPWLDDYIPLDPEAFSDGAGAPYIGSGSLINAQNDECPLLMMSLFYYHQLDRLNEIWIPSNWTDQEVFYELWWEMLLSRQLPESGDYDDDGKIFARKMKVVDLMDYEDRSLSFGLMYSIAKELRFGSCLVNRDSATEPNWARNYTMRLLENTPSTLTAFQGARPSPDYTSPVRLKNIHNKDAVDEFMSIVFGSSTPTAVKASTPPKLPEKEVKEVKKEAKPPDVAKESVKETSKSQEVGS